MLSVEGSDVAGAVGFHAVIKMSGGVTKWLIVMLASRELFQRAMLTIHNWLTASRNIDEAMGGENSI